MHIFIDANIFLDFYRLSYGDLEELRKIAKLTENEKITLYLSELLVDEYSRNRENAIAQAVNQFKNSKILDVRSNMSIKRKIWYPHQYGEKYRSW